MVVPGREQDAVRSFYAAWTAGDVETMLAIADPGIEAAPTLGLLYDRSVYRGHDGIRAWCAEVAGRWDRFEPQVEHTYLYGDQIAAAMHLVASRDGRDFDARFVVFHRFRDGRMVTLRGRDWYEAHEELGLVAPPLG